MQAIFLIREIGVTVEKRGRGGGLSLIPAKFCLFWYMYNSL